MEMVILVLAVAICSFVGGAFFGISIGRAETERRWSAAVARGEAERERCRERQLRSVP